jgi:hypothetical protein
MYAVGTRIGWTSEHEAAHPLQHRHLTRQPQRVDAAHTPILTLKSCPHRQLDVSS